MVYIGRVKSKQWDLDWNTIHQEGFERACAMGRLEVVRFLTTSEKLREQEYEGVNIHAQGHDNFND